MLTDADVEVKKQVPAVSMALAVLEADDAGTLNADIC
jgi:hypothetical protein